MHRQTQLPLFCAFFVIAGFYMWTAASDNLSWRFGEEQTDYYNLLVHGFLKGQLSLDAEVPQELLQVANPYDPAQRPPGVALHDASLFHGKYYIYYGVVPAVLLLLPFRLATGCDLPLGAAVQICAWATAVFSLLLLGEIRRRFFPRVGPLALASLGVTVGVASCVAILVRRASMYELPIACGAACAQAALWCWFRAIFGVERRIVWLVATSVCWGLAIGSRPIYLLAPVSLALAWPLFRNEGDGRSRAWFGRWRWVAAAICPLALVGALLAYYNYARFGDPREFGLSYILSGVYEAKIEHFRPRYGPWNFQAYFLATADWGRYFPFFHGKPMALPTPRQHYGMDFPFGLLINVPFLWSAGLVALGFGWKVGAEGRREWRVFVMSLVWVALSVLGFILGFYAAMARYIADFAPTLALLAGIGAFGVLDVCARSASMAKRWLAGAIIALAAAVSVFAVFLFTATLHGRFRDNNPLGFQAMARVANIPVHWFESVRGVKSGPLVLRVSLPADTPAGRREELVATGWAGDRDRVSIIYADANRIQFGFEHSGAPTVPSESIAVDRGESHMIRIWLGSLFPPESDAVFDDWSETEESAALHRVRIEFDGRCVLDRHQRFYDAAPSTLSIGGGRDGAGAFSGRVLESTRESSPAGWRTEARARAPSVNNSLQADASGTVRLRVRFPRGRIGDHDPLIVTGETGRGDFVIVEYLTDHTLRFILDHWGRRPYLSAPIPYEPERAYQIEIRHPFFAPGSFGLGRVGEGKLTVSIDGRVVWECEPLLYPVQAEDIFVGANPIGGTSCGEKFGGEITP